MRHQGSTLRLWRQILTLARPFRLQMTALLGLSLLATPVALLTPLPLKIVIDNVVGGAPLPAWVASVLPWPPASLAIAAAVVVLLAVALLNQLQGMAVWVLQASTSEQLLLRLRAQLFAHVQRLSLAYHDARGSSDATYRIHYDAQSVQNLAVNGVVPLITSATTLAAMLAVITRLDWRLALVAAATTPPLFWLARRSSDVLWKQWDAIKRHDSSSMAVIHEVLGSLRVVKAFGQEDHEYERFVSTSTRAVDGQIRLARSQGLFNVAVGMTIATGMAVSLYVGSQHVVAGLLSAGDLIIVMAYIAQLFAPVEAITKRFGQLQGAVAGAQRAFALLDEAPAIVERPRARALTRAAGAMEFRNVSFEYESERPALQDVSFVVPAGARVGIAGRTGAGKTTLINLLTRFYDPTRGVVCLDGVDIRDYRLVDLRNQFGIVLQEPVLFSTTLGENIAYARPGASRQEIEAAARLARAHDFISALPEGYDTPVGERGLRLSGGERQRVSLARAFLKDAPILVLDEPTSAVDTGTETEIMEAMERLMHGRTTFMIAHRLSTLESCDLRLTLDHGRLASYTIDGRSPREAAAPRS